MLMQTTTPSQGDLVGPAAFFGYMGVSCALVFASIFFDCKPPKLIARSWRCLWHCEKWSRNQQHGCSEARFNNEINYSGCHGRYLGYLWYDSCCHPLLKKYFPILLRLLLVKKDDYDFFRGYGHLAAGLCCGLSSLVFFNLIRIYQAAGLAIGIVGDAGVRANA